MLAVRTLYRTSIGKKVVMALTGLIMALYVLVHMIGNLKVFSGAAYFNEYAIFLREVGAPIFGHEQVLWLVRLVLLASVGLHIWASIQLTQMDLAGRPVGYTRRIPQASTYAGRTIRFGGVILGLFIIFHLLHMTLGVGIANFGGHENAYANFVTGFRNPIVTGAYLLAMLALGLHLRHGLWSFAQTLGWRSPANDGFWQALSIAAALIIPIGFAIGPLAVLLGFVR